MYTAAIIVLVGFVCLLFIGVGNTEQHRKRMCENDNAQES